MGRSLVAAIDVPELAPGKADSGGATGRIDGIPYGAYSAEVCADFKNKIKELKEKNNCASVGNFYVIPISWSGSLSGSSSAMGGVTETFKSDQATYTLAETPGDGRFRYAFTGPVTYTIAGTDSQNCVWSGSDTYAYPPGADLNGRLSTSARRNTSAVRESGPFRSPTRRRARAKRTPTPGPWTPTSSS